MVKTLTRSPDCPPAAGSLNPATLNDAKTILECFPVIAYRPFPSELRIQAIGFTTPDPWSFDDDPKINQVFIARLTFVFAFSMHPQYRFAQLGCSFRSQDQLAKPLKHEFDHD